MASSSYSSSHHFLMVATALFSLLVFYPSQTLAGNVALSGATLVQRVCGDPGIDDRTFCFKILSDSRATSTSNAAALSKVIFKLAKADAEASQDVINGLLRSGTFQKSAATAVQSCLSGFQAAAKSFKMVSEETKEDAMSALRSKTGAQNLAQEKVACQSRRG